MFLLLQLDTTADLHGFINDLGKPCHFVDYLPVPVFHFLHDFQWPVFLTKGPVGAFPVNPFHFQKVVCPSCAFDVKGNQALRMLALDAGPTILATANDALKTESLCVNLGHTHWGLGSHYRSRNPHSTAQMHPLVKSLCVGNISFLQPLCVALQEESVIFGNASHLL